MNENRNEDAAARVGEIIAGFMQANPQPSLEQWKQLIEKHVDVAGDIAEAALLVDGAEHLVEKDVEAPLNHAAFNASISKAINLVHKTPSPVMAYIDKKVSDVLGPAVKELAWKLGLGAAPALLSSVLAGSVKVPRKLLDRLASAFETNNVALQQYFLSSFQRQHIPAFKAEQGKPQVAIEPTPWADAVRASALPEKLTNELLELDN